MDTNNDTDNGLDSLDLFDSDELAALAQGTVNSINIIRKMHNVPPLSNRLAKRFQLVFIFIAADAIIADEQGLINNGHCEALMINPDILQTCDSPLEADFYLRWASREHDLALPDPTPQYKFHESRKFRADFCWTSEMLIVEIDGGTHTRGRHTRHEGYKRDCEKLNLAQELGYRVLRFTNDMITDDAIKQVCRMLNK